ncbi:hypothetical protein H1R20_g1777, partial [Candolleomyces eurysporus]
MSSSPLHPTTKHYIHFSITPPLSDALRLRKSLSDALDQAFGATSAAVNIDVLWLAEDGKDVVLRVHPDDAPKVLAAAVSSLDNGPRLSLVRESPFLPSLAVRGLGV